MPAGHAPRGPTRHPAQNDTRPRIARGLVPFSRLPAPAAGTSAAAMQPAAFTR
jgi:hypothetical protein